MQFGKQLPPLTRSRDGDREEGGAATTSKLTLKRPALLVYAMGTRAQWT